MLCRRVQQELVAHANNKRDGGFWTGFALGGAIFGAAGFFFAPQVRSNNWQCCFHNHRALLAPQSVHLCMVQIIHSNCLRLHRPYLA